MTGKRKKILSMVLILTIVLTSLALSPLEENYAPEIVWGPNDCSIPENMTATFIVEVTGFPIPDCQWQVSTDNGSSWSDLTDPAYSEQSVTGFDSIKATLTLEGKTTQDSGSRYRCMAGNTEGSAVSGVATLTVAEGAAAFASVTNITDVPISGNVDTPLKLSGTVQPDFATNKTIVWSIRDADETGATITGDTLNIETAGSLVVTATVINGIDAATDFTKDFFIYRNPPLIPYINGPESMELTAGYKATQSGFIGARGDPMPTVTISTDNDRITWDQFNEALDIAAGLKAGVYTIVITASNGNPPDATHTFTLTVLAPDGPEVSKLAVTIMILAASIVVISFGFFMISRKKK